MNLNACPAAFVLVHPSSPHSRHPFSSGKYNPNFTGCLLNMRMIAAAVPPRATDVTVPLLCVMRSHFGELSQLLAPIYPTAQTHFSGAVPLRWLINALLYLDSIQPCESKWLLERLGVHGLAPNFPRYTRWCAGIWRTQFGTSAISPKGLIAPLVLWVARAFSPHDAGG